MRRARHAVNHDPARVAASFAEHEAIMAALRIRAPLDLADPLARHNRATARAILAKLRGLQDGTRLRPSDSRETPADVNFQPLL